ncbi:MAG: hypothetical protein E7Z70_06695 [Thermoplasmata archaeon]|nr:hypothetical protein [Thermoplasmata archaeon]
MDKKTQIAIIAVIVVVIVAAAAYFITSNKEDPRILLDGALEVYGNADNDWTIGSSDADFVQSIVDGKTTWSKTDNPYADANHDGSITAADVTQIKALANNTAKTVWIKDGVGTEMEVKCQPQRIYAFQVQNAELATIMGYGDKIVAGGPPIQYYEPLLFPDNPNDVQYFSGDYERFSELNLDLYLVFAPTQIATPTEKLPNVDVVYLGLYYPRIADMESSVYAQGILKAGYIFGAKERAEGYLDFLLDIRDEINSYVKDIPDSDRPEVLVSQLSNTYYSSEDVKSVVAYTKNDAVSQAVALAGGKNVARGLPNYDSDTSYSQRPELEWMDTVDIDFTTVHFQRYAWTGLDLTSPEGGYTATDPEGMYDWISTIAGRPLIDIDEDNIIMLPQENRNGSHGSILTAAYLFQAFYPEIAKKNNFDPDKYMKEFIVKWLGVSDYDYAAHEDAMIAWGGRPTND